MIESEIKEEPLFSFRHFFRPTEKNVLIWSTTIKGLCVTGMATSFATANTYIFLTCLILGGICESFIYFTSKKPVAVIEDAVEDIKTDIITEQENDSIN